MAPISKAHAAWARQIAQLLQARGKCSGLILKEVGLDAAKLSGQVPFAKQAALFEAAAVHLEDSCFGLHFGSGADPIDLDALGYVATGSPALGDGLRSILTYLSGSADGMHAKLSMDSELAFLAVDFIDSETRPEILHRRQIHEFGPVLMMSLLRLVAGRRVCPVWVGFRHNRTEDLDGFERFFGCPVNFGRPKTSIVLKRDLLGLPSKPVDERLLSILKGHCQEALGRRGEAVSLEDELAYLVASHLHAGAPASHLVARELGLSERTMARRLAGQGTSFGRIVDRVRRHLAMRYLEEPNARASQVAYLLGYSEPSAFNHAFRRWTGVSPSEYVAEH